MLRRYITAVIVLAVLLQGATASAAPARMVAPQERGGAVAQMPCQAQAQAGAKCCGSTHCVCGEFCASASASLPSHPPELDDYIAAHFAALSITPQVFPAHALNRLRPPIPHSS